MLIKKPKTYDQQIAILKNKNIAIIDDVSAKTFLKQVNYYRFSGYFLPFQINGHGSLFPNIIFERLQAIYEFFSFGTLSYFYRGMKNNDKAAIAASLYGINYQTLNSWMRCLNDLRNKCAHYSRLYYWIFPAIPKMPSSEVE